MCVTALNSSWINELKNKSAIIVHHDASLEVGGNGAKNDFFMIVRGYWSRKVDSLLALNNKSKRQFIKVKFLIRFIGADMMARSHHNSGIECASPGTHHIWSVLRQY